MPVDTNLRESIQSSSLSLSEEVRACCTIAREQLEKGNYDAGCAALQQWWRPAEWPRHHGLSNQAAAELLLTAGTLSGCLASTRQVQGDQKWAEGLLNGAIALFEQLEERSCAAEGRIELAGCYYREGLFDLARATLRCTLESLSEHERDLKAVALIRLASVERHAGRLHDALNLLNETAPIAEAAGPWTQGRLHSEFATTLKELGVAENRVHYFDRALGHYREALLHFEKIGNLRFVAAVENNHGYLLLNLKRLDEALVHLQRARKLLQGFGDSVGCAQVDETLAQLYLASKQHGLAERTVSQAVDILERTGENALLAEALATQGLVLCRLGRRHEAKPALERARRVAERCGDHESAGRALLIMIEEMCDQLSDDERRETGAQARQLLANSQQAATRVRLELCLEKIAAAHAEHEARRERATHADKMSALGELAFGVAHNVNNALAGIQGRAQLLLRTADPAKVASGLEVIIKSADDGAQIIRRIQDFARQEPSHEFQAISISGLLTDTFEMTRPRWQLRPEATVVRFAPPADCAGFLMGDPVEMREVLVNMIYNAVDALPHGGEIRLSAQVAAGRVTVSIADTGTGMPPEVKARMFDPFFTTKGKAGTGMGLAVSFGIVRRHDGLIDVESEPGRGTTFHISLPTVEVTDPVNSDSGPAITNVMAAERALRLRVLVVDDEAVVRDVLAEALEAEGCEVLAAESGAIALELYDAHEGELDAVFTDVGMSDLSGWDLITAIRKRSKAIPLAIISGCTDNFSSDARNATKADWVVSKPFDIDRIAEIAREIAERKRQAA